MNSNTAFALFMVAMWGSSAAVAIHLADVRAIAMPAIVTVAVLMFGIFADDKPKGGDDAP